VDYRLLIFAALVALAIAAKLGSRRLYAFAKPMPLVFILFLAFINPHVVPGLWLAAIGFGLAGDLLLLSEKGFLPGLLSFLLGHIYYIFAFYRAGAGDVPLYVALGVVLTCLTAFAYLARHLVAGRRKKYILPVFMYIAVTGMLIAVSLKYPIVSFAVPGTVLFGLSDFLLAFNKFVRPSWYAQASVSLTYFAAQWLLARHFAGI
jgi:uncharacterized membrane protein YhhN